MDSETIENIKKAHDLQKHEYKPRFKNIGDALDFWTTNHPYKNFLSFYDDDGLHGHRELTYKDFSDMVNRTANFLLSLGIGKGDRVATIFFNHYKTVVIYFAALKIGATVVPLNCLEEPAHNKFVLENSESKVVFFFHKFENSVPEFSGYKIQVGGEKGNHVLFDEEIIKRSAELNLNYKVDADQDALIVYTSGTTGVPKGVLLSQENMLIDARGISEHYKFTQSDRFMCVLPIHHVNGIIVTLMTPLYVGASIVLNKRFNTKTFWERIDKEKVTVVSVVPTLLQFLLEGSKDISKYNLSHFKRIICGAGPLTVDLATRFEDAFGFRITHGYGLSETTCYSCYLPTDLDDHEHKKLMRDYGFPSIGTEIGPNEMAIHDSEGNSLKEGEKGEIVIRGKNVMKEYLKRPDSNKDTFKNGWFRSGDEGFFITDGKERKHFFITGRMKELIIRGGTNISPLELDEILNSLQGVGRGIAVGFENKWYGEEVGAAIKLKDGVKMSEEDIINMCKEKIAFFKRPKAVVFVDDIPVTSTGKYQRNKMKHLFEKYKDVQFRE